MKKATVSAKNSNIETMDQMPSPEEMIASIAAAQPTGATVPSRATFGFNKLSLPDFQTRFGIILGKMDGNRSFSTLQAQVDDLKNDKQTFDKFVVAAAHGDRTAILERDEARTKITEKLLTLGTGVTMVANGNLTVLSSSGFPYVEPRKPTPPLVQPDPPKVRRNSPNGVIKVYSRRQKGVTSVVYLIATEAEGEYEMHPGNKVKMTFENLVRGQMYYIKVMFTGVKDQKVTSEYVTAIAP